MVPWPILKFLPPILVVAFWKETLQGTKSQGVDGVCFFLHACSAGPALFKVESDSYATKPKSIKASSKPIFYVRIFMRMIYLFAEPLQFQLNTDITRCGPKSVT